MKQAVLVLFFIVITIGTQSPVRGQSPAQETPARGYWNDPSTGLMWAAKDNGGDITWGNAMKYCQNLNLAGYSGWRLPSVDELEGIYDGGASSPGHSQGSIIGLSGSARGGLLLTGAREWSNSRVLDDRGRNTGFAWQYDYPHGRRWKDPLGYKGSLRALCVRHP
jgi:hypothetical protein